MKITKENCLRRQPQQVQ